MIQQKQEFSAYINPYLYVNDSLLELLGNRKTIIFVEGEKGGKDHAIYQSIYRNYNIVPRGGCQSVIELVRLLRLNSCFYHIDVYGIIDRDYRTDEEINTLSSEYIFCIDVAEIENILLNEDILRLIAKKQHLDPDNIVQSVTDKARKLLNEQIEVQASRRTCRKIENNLYKINTKSKGLEAIKQSVADAISNLGIETIYQENLELYTRLASAGTLSEILKYYNNKGLVKNICSIFELGNNGYEGLVLRMLNSNEREQIISGLQRYVPSIPDSTKGYSYTIGSKRLSS